MLQFILIISRNYQDLDATPQQLNSTNDNDGSFNDSTHSKSIDLDEITTKVLKRINDLLVKPIAKDNEAELTKRILDIKERQEEAKLAIDVASQTAPSESVSNIMTVIRNVLKAYGRVFSFFYKRYVFHIYRECAIYHFILTKSLPYYFQLKRET